MTTLNQTPGTHSAKRIGKLLAGTCVIVILAACGGGGGGSGGSNPGTPPDQQPGNPTNPINPDRPNPVDPDLPEPVEPEPEEPELEPFPDERDGPYADLWFGRSMSHTFSHEEAARIRNSDQFRTTHVNPNSIPSDDGPIIPGGATHAYELIRLDIARSGGLSGNDTTTMVVDSGFRTTHQQFDGKSIYTYGNVNSASGNSHGTHVAALAAGRDDIGSMMGVAPGSDLYLALYHDGHGSAIDLENLANATRNAVTIPNVVAQNNSWGAVDGNGDWISAAEVLTYRDTHGVTGAEALQYVVGDTASRWQDYIDALDDFQETGVIVWGMSNDEDLIDGGALAALPVIAPELGEAFIAVGNGAFRVGEDGIEAAARLSAACGIAAQHCLFASGTTRSASGESDTGYQLGSGASYAAPQVAGAVALMAEAFPDLSPREWTARLLASANNSFDEFVADGTTDFGNGIQHDYSEEWGHGVLDVASALSALKPIGDVSVMVAGNVTSAERFDVSDLAIQAGAAMGNGVAVALANATIAAFDGLNTNFSMNASEIVSAASQRRTRLNRDVLEDAAGYAFTSGSSEVAVLGGPAQAVETLSLATTAQAEAEFVRSGSESILALARHGASFSHSLLDAEHDGFDLDVIASASTHEFAADGYLAGGGVAATFGDEDASIRVGASAFHEGGAVMGMAPASNAELLGMPDQALHVSGHLSARVKIADGWTLSGGAELGRTFAGAGTGLVSSINDLTFSGWSAAISYDFGEEADISGTTNHRITASVSQPLRAESGSMAINLPTGRTPSGEIVSETVNAGLAPSGRQIDVGVSYGFDINENTSFDVSLTHSFDYGHVPGVSDTRVQFGLFGRF